MRLHRQTGNVKDREAMNNPAFAREARFHFDLLCERYADSGWIEMNVSSDGVIQGAVERRAYEQSGVSIPWGHTDPESIT